MNARSREWRLPRVLAACFLLLGVVPLAAQEFEPRTYSVAPVGMNFFAIGYGFATGAVFMDPALPVDDVDGQVHVVVARYIRTLEAFGRPAKLKLGLPWSSGHWDGFLEGEFRTRDATGLGDLRITFETLFAGAEIRTLAEMAEYTPGTVWGARVQAILPTGTYDSSKAINLGANRWGVIPEIGFAHPVGKWSLEGAVGAWFFGANGDFFGGQRLKQDPLLVAKFHAIRSIRPGCWWAVAGGYGYGGRTFVDGVKRATIQRNWRLSAMVAYPIRPNQGISLAVVTGGNYGAGTDADAVSIGYQVAW